MSEFSEEFFGRNFSERSGVSLRSEVYGFFWRTRLVRDGSNFFAE